MRARPDPGTNSSAPVRDCTEELGDYYFRRRGLWSGKGKAIPRLLRRVDAELSSTYCDAFNELFARGDATPVIRLAEALMKEAGGTLFEGYRADAPATWRTKPPAVIFDMDGVLLDTERLALRAWQQAATAEGLDFADELYRGMIGLSHAGTKEYLRAQSWPEAMVERVFTNAWAGYLACLEQDGSPQKEG